MRRVDLASYGKLRGTEVRSLGYTVRLTASFSLVSTDRLEGGLNTFIKLVLLIGRGENKTLSLR